MHSLLLAPDTWDLFVDPNGNIAECYAEYAITQNVSNACRLFTNDAYYEPDRGIPHFAVELKEQPALSILKTRLKEAAENVDGVSLASVNNINIANRQVSGQLCLILDNGEVTYAGL